MARMHRLFACALSLLLLVSPGLAAEPARNLFGAVHTPTGGPPISIGGYAKGCLAGAVQLPTDGDHWQAMRLSRDRRWGTDELVDYIEALAQSVAQDGRRGILVGDMGQARGGPMATGHASHQIGLDADFWFLEMPDHQLSADDELVLGGILRFALRLERVEPPARDRAFRAAAAELQLPVETALVEVDRGGYRDAAVVMEVVRSDLDRVLERARREIADDDALRALIERVEDPRVREAFALAVDGLERHLGEARPRSLFVDWLRETWLLPPEP